MNILHLKYAIEVARTGSITQAADNLYMGQPNLSKAIKELEDSLKIDIFKRTSKGVVPTPKGERFLEYAKKALAQIDKMEELYKPENPNRQSFSILIPRGSYIASAVTKLVASLDTEREIDVNIKETNSLQTIYNIIDGEFNLGIIRYQTIHENYFVDFLADKNMKTGLIWEFEYLVLMSKHHPLANAASISSADLEKYTEITHGDNSVPYINPNDGKKVYNSSPKSRHIYVYERGNQFDILTHIPTTYMYVSPVPEEMLERYDLVQRRCNMPNNLYKDVIFYPEDYNLSELDRRFMDMLFASKNEVAFREYK